MLDLQTSGIIVDLLVFHASLARGLTRHVLALLKHVLKRFKQAMQVPHDFGLMWFGAKSVVKGCVGAKWCILSLRNCLATKG